jgi:penicillin amidase
MKNKMKTKLCGKRMSVILLVAVLGINTVLSANAFLAFGADRWLPGIVQDYVYVYRDNWGVPHIYAQSVSDAYFALGYVMAEDRLFEMDLFRRSVAGRVAEIMGPDAFSQDVLMRTLGVYQIALDTWNGVYPDCVVPDDIKENLQQFSSGVNRFIADIVIPYDVPIEYRTLSMSTGIPLTYFIPYPWTPADSLAIAGMMGLMLTDTSEAEIMKGAFTAMVEPALQAQTGISGWSDYLLPISWVPGTTISMADPELVELGLIESITAPLRELFGGFGDGLGGSNNWVISGLNTTTGNAMLANDPHLDLQAPGINWQVHINVPGWANVIGCCIPGGPVIYTGHNDYIAFGVTNLMADVMDLYYYEPANETHYWYVDHWEPFTVTPVVIRNFTIPYTIPVVSTRHGPMITTPLPPPFDKMAIKWAGKESGYGEVTGFSRLMNATSLAEWKQALSHQCVIIQNYVAADKLGNIAWCPSGKIPLRPPPDPPYYGTLGVVPSNGSAGQNEWMGWLPHSTAPVDYSFDLWPGPVSLPYIENPPQGFIATANNEPIGPGYFGYPWPIWIGPAFGFDPGYRAERITELIKTLAPIDIEDMKLIQADSVSIPARNMVPIILGSMGFPGSTGNATIDQALAILASWNHSELRDLVAPLIWEVFLEKYGYNTFNDEFGPYGLYPFPNTIIPLWNMTIDMALGNPNMYAFILFDNKNTPGYPPPPYGPGGGIWEIMPQIINQSLHDAINWIAGQLGPDMSTWQYGKLHVVNFGHPMGSKVSFLNVPSSPVGCDGGPFTVDPGGYSHKLIVKEVLYVDSGASYRGIYECKNGWDTSIILVPPGESGRVTGIPAPLQYNIDPHYGDTFLLWLNNGYTPCLFDDTIIQTYPRTIFYPAFHNVAVTALTPSSTIVIIGTTIQINVTVKNDGTTNEDFTVTLSYDSNVIDTESVTNLAPMTTKLLTFSWDTTGVTPGDYTLTAAASTVPGEIHLVDNVKTILVRLGMAPTMKVEPPVYTAHLLNETFSINITINNLGQNWKVVALQFRLCYNTTLLQFASATEGAFLKDARWNLEGTFFACSLASDPPYGPNVLVGMLLYPNGTGQWNAFPSGSGVLATITFKVVYQPPRGYDKDLGYMIPIPECDLTLNATKIISAEGYYIPHNLQHGKYRILPANIADINYDGIVDISDIYAIALSFGETPDRPRWNPELDVNHDGVIDIADIYTAARNYGST